MDLITFGKLFPLDIFTLVEVKQYFEFLPYDYGDYITLNVYPDANTLDDPKVWYIPSSCMNVILGAEGFVPENLLRSPLDLYEILEDGRIRNMRR